MENLGTGEDGVEPATDELPEINKEMEHSSVIEPGSECFAKTADCLGEICPEFNINDQSILDKDPEVRSNADGLPTEIVDKFLVDRLSCDAETNDITCSAGVNEPSKPDRSLKDGVEPFVEDEIQRGSSAKQSCPPPVLDVSSCFDLLEAVINISKKRHLEDADDCGNAGKHLKTSGASENVNSCSDLRQMEESFAVTETVDAARVENNSTAYPTAKEMDSTVETVGKTTEKVEMVAEESPLPPPTQVHVNVSDDLSVPLMTDPEDAERDVPRFDGSYEEDKESMRIEGSLVGCLVSAEKVDEFESEDISVSNAIGDSLDDTKISPVETVSSLSVEVLNNEEPPECSVVAPGEPRSGTEVDGVFENRSSPSKLNLGDFHSGKSESVDDLNVDLHQSDPQKSPEKAALNVDAVTSDACSSVEDVTDMTEIELDEDLIESEGALAPTLATPPLETEPTADKIDASECNLESSDKIPPNPKNKTVTESEEVSSKTASEEPSSAKEILYDPLDMDLDDADTASGEDGLNSTEETNSMTKTHRGHSTFRATSGHRRMGRYDQGHGHNRHDAAYDRRSDDYENGRDFRNERESWSNRSHHSYDWHEDNEAYPSKRRDSFSNFGPRKNRNGPHSPDFASPSDYGPHGSDFGQPRPDYGPHGSDFGLPRPDYRPPGSDYGPPGSDYGPDYRPSGPDYPSRGGSGFDPAPPFDMPSSNYHPPPKNMPPGYQMPPKFPPHDYGQTAYGGTFPVPPSGYNQWGQTPLWPSSMPSYGQSNQQYQEWCTWWQNYTTWYQSYMMGWNQPQQPVDPAHYMSQGSWSSAQQQSLDPAASFAPPVPTNVSAPVPAKSKNTEPITVKATSGSSGSKVSYKPTVAKGPVLNTVTSISTPSAGPKLRFSLPVPFSATSMQKAAAAVASTKSPAENSSAQSLVAAAEKTDQDTENNIWVGNLPSGTCAVDVRTLISRFGKVVKCKVGSMKSQKDAGLFALVTMETSHDVAICIQMLHESMYRGQKILVKKLKQQ